MSNSNGYPNSFATVPLNWQNSSPSVTLIWDAQQVTTANGGATSTGAFRVMTTLDVIPKGSFTGQNVFITGVNVSQQVLPASSQRSILLLQNLTPNLAAVNFNAPAQLSGSGIILPTMTPFSQFFGNIVPNGAVFVAVAQTGYFCAFQG